MTETKYSRVLVVAATTVVALCLLALMGAIPGEAAFPGTNGPIAFQSDRDGPQEIYTVTPGGTANRITFSSNSSDPAISPDGSRIAFVNNSQITVMNADGSGITPLTSTPTTKQSPAWSPDGTRLLFVANSFDVDGQTDLEIWVIDAGGGVATQLTNNTFPDLEPAWSPLGNQIAFVATRPGDTNRNIYVMDSGGNGQTSITPNNFTDCTGTPPNPDTCFSGHDDAPAWSPDGTKIAFVHEQAPNGGGPPNIWTMDPSGANKDNLSDSAVSFINPAWSPQGDMLAAVGTAPATTNRDIWVMNSGGGGQTPIEPNPAHDISPDWGATAPPPDPLTLKLKAKKVQQLEKLKVKAECSNPCELSARAKGKADKKFRSKRVKRELAANEPLRLKLKLPKAKLDKIDDEKGKATIKATATDTSGQSASDKVKVKIKP